MDRSVAETTPWQLLVFGIPIPIFAIVSKRQAQKNAPREKHIT